MARFIVNGEEVFSVPTWNFSISPSNEGYTLNYSADGKAFSAWGTATAAGAQEIVVNAPANMFYKLIGNKGKVTVTW